MYIYVYIYIYIYIYIYMYVCVCVCLCVCMKGVWRGSDPGVSEDGSEAVGEFPGHDAGCQEEGASHRVRV